jgi:hypothetical protein
MLVAIKVYFIVLDNLLVSGIRAGQATEIIAGYLNTI